MLLFQIPLFSRFTWVGKGRSLCDKKKYMCIDDLGFLVHYTDEKDLTLEVLRKHRFAREETRVFIEAKDLTEAIEIFFRDFEGATTGGDENPEQKAIWINTEKPFLELPHCDRMNRNKKDEFICGEICDDDVGEYGMCILEGYDDPENCPIANFFDNISKKTSLEEVETERGTFKLRRSKMATIV